MASVGDPDETDDRVTVLSFTLDEQRYCIRSDAVETVLAVGDDDSIASAPNPWNAGTVSVAGERIRIVDLPRAFASSARTTSRIEDPKLLVLDVVDDGCHYGWLVDDVDVTRTVRERSLEPTRTSTRLSHVRGRLEIDGERVVWLDEREIHG